MPRAGIKSIHRVGSTTIQRLVCMVSWSQQPVSWVWWIWEIVCLEWESNPHLWHSGPVCYHHPMQASWCHTIPTPSCLCSSLPQRSVQTTTINRGIWQSVLCILVIVWRRLISQGHINRFFPPFRQTIFYNVHETGLEGEIMDYQKNNKIIYLGENVNMLF